MVAQQQQPPHIHARHKSSQTTCGSWLACESILSDAANAVDSLASSQASQLPQIQVSHKLYGEYPTYGEGVR